MKKKKIKIDPRRLLGFRIEVIGGTQQGAKTGPKNGSKSGGAVGVKPV